MAAISYLTAPWSFHQEAAFGGQYSASDPTILRDGDLYRMFYTEGSNDGTRIRPAIAEAVSADGQTWTQLGGNVGGGIVVEGDGAAKANLEGACIFKAGATYVLLYSGYADGAVPNDSFPASLYAATSTDGLTFTPVADAPVLAPTQGWFDNDAVFSPTVVQTASGYLMLYAGHSYSDGAAIGGPQGVVLLAATSPDGIAWTKADAPVLLADPSIAWTIDGVAEPSLLLGPDGLYYLFFTGLHGDERAIGIAVAADPLGPWTVAPQPIITAAALGLAPGSTVIAPHAELDNGVLRLWFSAATPAGVHSVAYAEADWGGGVSGSFDGPPHWVGTDLDDVIQGRQVGDLVTTGGGNDLIAADGGDDTVDAGAGDDEVWAGDGDDSVAGGDGDDNLDGGAGSNTIDGGAGHDVIGGGDGDESLLGGAGDDTIYAGGGADRIDAGDGNDEVWAGDGPDSVQGGNGDDTLYGGSVSNTIEGGAGADFIAGEVASDNLRGGIGADTIYGNDGNDTIDAGADDDIVLAGAGDDSVLGGTGIDQLFGETGSDTLDGGDGADLLVGEDGADRLSGGAGDDSIVAGEGADSAIGGEGNDLLDGGGGDDTLDGGSGADVLDGGAFDDPASANLLLGGAGTDLLVAGAGTDTLDGGDDADSLDGGAGEDLLSGGGGSDLLFGGDDGDRLVGGAGADTLDGGFGIDTADYAQSARVTVALDGSIAGAGDAAGDLLVSVENLIGSATGGDSLRGDEGENRIEGLGGNDTIDGGAGADALAGGIGNDVYVVDDAGDQVIEAANAGIDTVRTAITWVLGANVEKLAALAGISAGLWLAGNALDNAITGGVGNDTLDGVGGADVLTGGAGNDLYFVDNPGDRAIEAVGGGIDTVVTAVSFTLVGQVENLTVLASTTTGLALTGNALANLITGGAGADTIAGDKGVNTLAGGLGDDLYQVDSARDIVVEEAGEGIDTVLSTVSLTLGDNIEILAAARGVTAALTLRGNLLDNSVTGGSGADQILGNDGNDTLAGGRGNDRLTGGSGQDAFLFDTAPNGTTNLDRITDFSVLDDVILLGRGIFTGLGPLVGAPGADVFRAGPGAAAAGNAAERILYDTTTGTLSYDADGLGGVGAVALAIFDHRPALTVADFLLV